MAIVIPLYLDVAKSGVPQTVYTKIGDTVGARQIAAVITDKGIRHALESDALVGLTLWAEGVRIGEASGVVDSEGRAVIDLPTLESEGVYLGQVEITVNGVTLSTEPFRVQAGGPGAFDTSVSVSVIGEKLPSVTAKDVGKGLVASVTGWVVSASRVVLEEQYNKDIGALEADVADLKKNGTKGAVLYTEQTLTDEEKAQARANIGAASNEEKPHATSLDLSTYDSGTMTETLSDGSKVTYTVTFDENGNPTNINNGTDDFAIVWGDT